MTKKVKGSSDVHNELVDIKKLLILKLLADGVSQTQIATALGMDPGNLSRLVPARLAKKTSKGK